MAFSETNSPHFAVERPVRMTNVLLAAALVVSHVDSAQGQSRTEFGFTLNPNTQGDLHTLFLYTMANGNVVGGVSIRTEAFLLQMAGLMESKANLEGVDLFEQYGITGYGVAAGSPGTPVGTDLGQNPFNDLWKLRYRSMDQLGLGLGWAGEEMRPSERQQIILQHYRLPQHQHWHGPYIGEGAFRLLRDMQDPAWVATYQRGG